MSYEQVQLPQGFTILTQSSIKRRIIMAVQKRPKNGGTHFSLTVPGTVAYLNFDKESGEDVLPKFINKKPIAPKNYWLSKADMDGADKKDVQDMAKAIIDEFEADFYALLKSDARSIVLDTETELNQYKRLADFGKLTQIMPHHYASVNQWFRTLMDQVMYSDKNLVLLERSKKEYVNDSWSGGYDRAGFSEAPFLVQLNAAITRLEYPNENGVYPFEMTVVDSSQNANIKGLKLQSDPSKPADWSMLTGVDAADRAMTMQDQCNFPWLAVHVFPDTKLSDWV